MEQQRPYEKALVKKMRLTGILAPLEADEIEAFDAIKDQLKIPTLPDEISDPMKILARGFSEPVDLSPEIDHGTVENLSMAARNGKEIPPQVLAQMLKDREDAEKKRK